MLLANIIESCRLSNVSLFNATVSETTTVMAMRTPQHETLGLRNFYQARLSSTGDGQFKVLTLRGDSLEIPRAVKLVKIDAEGHELSVLNGMRKTLARDRPILIVEAPCDEAWAMLKSLDYTGVRLRGSPNVVFHRSDALREELERLA